MCISAVPEMQKVDITFRNHIIVLTKTIKYVEARKYLVISMSVVREYDKQDVTPELANGAREVIMESGDDLYNLMNKIKELEEKH